MTVFFFYSFRTTDHQAALTQISRVSENNCQQIIEIQNNLRNIESLLKTVIENQTKNERQVTSEKPNTTANDKVDGRNNLKNTEPLLSTAIHNQSKKKQQLSLDLGLTRATDNSESQNNQNDIKTLLESFFENQNKNKEQVSPNSGHTISTEKLDETSLSADQEDFKPCSSATKKPHIFKKCKKFETIGTDNQNPLSRSAVYPKTKVKRLPIQGFKISWQVMSSIYLVLMWSKYLFVP